MSAEERKKKRVRTAAAERQRRKRKADQERGITSVTLRVQTEFVDLIRAIGEHVLTHPDGAREWTKQWAPQMEARTARIQAERARRQHGADPA